jgi:hypothetical protein
VSLLVEYDRVCSEEDSLRKRSGTANQLEDLGEECDDSEVRTDLI